MPVIAFTDLSEFRGGGTERTLEYSLTEDAYLADIEWGFAATGTPEDYRAQLDADEPVRTTGTLQVRFFEHQDGTLVEVGDRYEQVATLYGYRTADALERAGRGPTGPMATPEPGSLILFGSGLAGVAWSRRRKTPKTAGRHHS
jgi:hypothetical protein